VVRVEPNGESVIAGRSVAGATIEMLRDGQVHARTAADQSGLFAFVPPVLQPGSHQVTLQSIAPDGTRQRSRDSVTIVVNEGGTTRPLVALTSPDKPTVLLSNPEAPEPKAAGSKTADAKPAEPGAGPPKGAEPNAAEPPRAEARSAEATPNQAAPQPQPGAPNQEPQRQAAAPQPGAPPSGQPPAPRPEVKITTVEAEEGGRLYVSGQAAPGSTVRLYLNDTFIAPGGVGADGKVAFAIGRGVRPGDYRVRIDDVDPVSGSVKSRAEVGFSVPVPVASTPPPPAGGPAPMGPQVAAAPPEPQVAAPPGAGPSRAPAVTPQVPAQTPPQSGSAPPQGPRPATVAPDALARAPAAGPAPATAPTPPSAAGAPAADSATDSGATRPNGSQVASVTPPELRDLPPGTVVIPDINTAIVSRGDNLWRISQRIYGKGVRYTVIYGANQSQIRNPNRIYPGQVFVLPDVEDEKTR
jgi:nucleoid-associated protein YgaU